MYLSMEMALTFLKPCLDKAIILTQNNMPFSCLVTLGFTFEPDSFRYDVALF